MSSNEAPDFISQLLHEPFWQNLLESSKGPTELAMHGISLGSVAVYLWLEHKGYGEAAFEFKRQFYQNNEGSTTLQ